MIRKGNASMKVKLFVMTVLLSVSIGYGIITYERLITGRQILWMLVFMCEWIYLDYYFNVKEENNDENR